MRICNMCKRKFDPSSKHRNCPSCRYHASKTILCYVCKTHNHSPKYKSCQRCTNSLKPEYGTGRYKRPNGYIMVFQKGHPRASKNYVFEHIVVMEKHLGRYLTLDENVHHKNGVKDDNSIKNLELWIKPQPAGIRAKDALNWAKRTVALYQPIQDKL